MNKLLLTAAFSALLALTACKEDTNNQITFVTSPEYPPFEFHKDNKLTGYDVELAKLIAQEMHKKIKIGEMPFNAIFAALQNGSVDAAIATITITDQRKKNFDFSNMYYTESMSVIFPKNAPIADKHALKDKKIATQLGTTMSIWLQNNVPEAKMVVMDNSSQAVEALKAGHVDGVLIDSVQASSFTKNNSGLGYGFIAKADNGYGIAVKKDSRLTGEINNALNKLKENGELDKLKQQWLENAKWNN